jgi:hypothetical protein
MSLLPFFEWVGSTDGSIELAGSTLLWPLIEATHVWTLPLFFGLTLLLDLRLLGFTMRDVPVSEVFNRLMPWMIAGFIVMTVTGLLLVYAKPVKTYQSIWFRAKFIMLILAGLNVWVFHRGIYRRLGEWDVTTPPRAARVAGAVSLVLWAGIVVTGRMIAYNWFDCDRQPQPDIVNILAGCVVHE